MTAHFFLLALLVKVCMDRDSVDPDSGVAWEFWVLYLHYGLSWGLIEVLLSRYDEKHLTLFAYPKAMIMAHIPLLSERVDTAKDVVFVAICLKQELMSTVVV